MEKKTVNLENTDKKLDLVLKTYNEFGEKEDDYLIKFINEHYDFLINYDTHDIKPIEDIAYMFNDYYFSLGICNHWKQIIEKRKDMIGFVSQLESRSKKYDRLFRDIEYVYATTLMNDGNNYKQAITTLKMLQEKFPKDEAVKLDFSIAKLYLRNKIYNVLSILGLIIIFGTLILRLVMNMSNLEPYSNIGWGILLLTILIQYIDKYNSKKSTAGNKS